MISGGNRMRIVIAASLTVILGGCPSNDSKKYSEQPSDTATQDSSHTGTDTTVSSSDTPSDELPMNATSAPTGNDVDSSDKTATDTGLGTDESSENESSSPAQTDSGEATSEPSGTTGTTDSQNSDQTDPSDTDSEPMFDPEECQAILDAALNTQSEEGDFYVGVYEEDPNSDDPTGGLIFTAVPSDAGAWFGQMVNTYVDCTGQMPSSGLIAGMRNGNNLTGRWTNEQLQGTWGGSWTGTVDDANTVASGTYDVDMGPKTDECSGEYGATECYCVDNGTFQVENIDNYNATSTENIPFEIIHDQDTVTLDSLNNVNTPADESTTGQTYAILDINETCSENMALIGFCPNPRKEDPVDASYNASCVISFPMGVQDIRNVTLCNCVFLEEYIEGHTYAVIGLNAEQSSESDAILAGDAGQSSVELFVY